jgi:hypothetical protein
MEWGRVVLVMVQDKVAVPAVVVSGQAPVSAPAKTAFNLLHSPEVRPERSVRPHFIIIPAANNLMRALIIK